MKFTPSQKIINSAIATVLPISLIACSASNPSTTTTSSSFVESAQATAQPTNISSNSCNATMQSAKSYLEQLQQGEIKIDQVAVATLNQSPPSDRPDAYVLTLSGQAASNVKKSPQLMRSISADLIGNCPTVSLVAFGKAQTDWSIHFGRVGSTQIEQFQCINEPTQNRLPWGYKRCL